jgi:hypothetical protein
MSVNSTRAYIDESGTHGDPVEPVILSGCISTASKWDRFDRAWGEMLKRHGLPYVHATELQGRRGAASHLNSRLLAELVGEIDRAIFRYVSVGFSTILLPDDFAHYRDSTGSGLNSILDSAYGVSFRIALSFLHAHAPSIFPSRYSNTYVFVESGHQNAGAVAEIFRQYQRQAEDQTVAAINMVGKGCYGTQAADVRGYVILNEEREKAVGYQDVPPTPEAMERFARAIPLPWFRLPLNRDVLNELRSNVILSKPKFLNRYGHLMDVTHVA